MFFELEKKWVATILYFLCLIIGFLLLIFVLVLLTGIISSLVTVIGAIIPMILLCAVILPCIAPPIYVLRSNY